MKKEKYLKLIITAIFISGILLTYAVNRYVASEIEKNMMLEATQMETSYGKYDYYINVFAEIESYFDKLKADENFEQPKKQKEAAASEFQRWEMELRDLYRNIVAGLSDSEAKALETEQNEWKKQRDSDALDAVSRLRGSNDNTEYIKSQAESTKIRAYELLERYKELLGKK